MWRIPTAGDQNHSCSATCLLARDIRHINPAGINKSPASQVVAAKPGTIIWISGQIAQNSKGKVVGKGDLKAQLNQAWENVKLALAGKRGDGLGRRESHYQRREHHSN
jgi:enamine deaminase RidA (YjgF/YER057c/UK114 family)